MSHNPSFNKMTVPFVRKPLPLLQEMFASEPKPWSNALAMDSILVDFFRHGTVASLRAYQKRFGWESHSRVERLINKLATSGALPKSSNTPAANAPANTTIFDKPTTPKNADNKVVAYAEHARMVADKLSSVTQTIATTFAGINLTKWQLDEWGHKIHHVKKDIYYGKQLPAALDKLKAAHPTESMGKHDDYLAIFAIKLGFLDVSYFFPELLEAPF